MNREGPQRRWNTDCEGGLGGYVNDYDLGKLVQVSGEQGDARGQQEIG